MTPPIPPPTPPNTQIGQVNFVQQDTHSHTHTHTHTHARTHAHSSFGVLFSCRCKTGNPITIGVGDECPAAFGDVCLACVRCTIFCCLWLRAWHSDSLYGQMRRKMLSKTHPMYCSHLIDSGKWGGPKEKWLPLCEILACGRWGLDGYTST